MESREEKSEPVVATRVRWSNGFAYVPGRVLVRGATALKHLEDVAGDRDYHVTELGSREDAPEKTWIRVEGVADALSVIALLRADGVDAQPEHVFFAHHCDPCCGPHPSETFDALASDPYHSTPYHSTPYHSTPYHSTPYHSTPYHSTAKTSSATPCARRAFPPRTLTGPGAHPRITVLDTGLADGAFAPAFLADKTVAPRVTGGGDAPDVAIHDPAGNVLWPQDGWLDPCAGHGTFIAGIIEQLAPGCTIRVEHIVKPLGDVVEGDVHTAIMAQAQLPVGQRPDILSLSFGGPVSDAGAGSVQTAIAYAQASGIVVVASAGNDGTSEPQYPAAYDGVVAVGALGPDGPTPWTNYGSWVNACAPGLNLVSSFFNGFNGPAPRVNTEDPDCFDGWATWSGTSFSTPVVVAALAREMVMGDCTAKQAVERVVDAPETLRIRCLGTVISTA